MTKKNLSFESQNLVVDWISFNIQGLPDPGTIASSFSKHFTPHVLLDGEPYMSYHGLKKKYKVSIRQYTGSKGYWVGTQIIFSGKDAAHCYNLIKTQKLDWETLKMDQHALSLGRIDLCFSRPNDLNHTIKTFDAFLVDSRSFIQDHTNTKYIKLQDFPKGKMLKVNRRNNSRHYRVYQKDESVRFELELKHRQTKLVQDYLFQNQLDMFEHLLVLQYFEYSGQVLRSDYPYTDWILNFQRRYWGNPTFRPLMISYFDNQLIRNQEEEERLFHLLQFLSFVREYSGEKQILNGQSYIVVEFLLSDFIKSLKCQKNSHQRKKFIGFFTELQTLPPYREEFADKNFRQLLFFPVVNAIQETKRGPWIIKIAIAEPLMTDHYPFHFPPSFFTYSNKVNLQVKLSIIQAIAQDPSIQKTYNVEIFLNKFTKRRNSIQAIIKKTIIEEFHNLVKFKIIQPKFRVQGKDNQQSIEKDFIEFKDLKSSKFITFYEIILIS